MPVSNCLNHTMMKFSHQEGYCSPCFSPCCTGEFEGMLLQRLMFLSQGEDCICNLLKPYYMKAPTQLLDLNLWLPPCATCALNRMGIFQLTT
ncbi:Asparagine--tRNA ligase [Frankliniella fusca]|uniref:Asparagine--tRNA ligase n=1 Tax=Frankliniella fusca TaxID=407009 RepID=A0AAE1L9A4_9NEOP|nr:Asparagine--tRNA ligase [Frankliniella fusca]